jgi:hypothetical protein
VEDCVSSVETPIRRTENYGSGSKRLQAWKTVGPRDRATTENECPGDTPPSGTNRRDNRELRGKSRHVVEHAANRLRPEDQ